MGLLSGHEDLKRKEIFGFNNQGHAMVDYGDEGLKPYRLFVAPGGSVQAEPVVTDEPGSNVDQIGGRVGRPTLADRMRGVDQL